MSIDSEFLNKRKGVPVILLIHNKAKYLYISLNMSGAIYEKTTMNGKYM